MSHYKFIILFFSIIIIQNINCFSLRKTKNGDETCEVNKSSKYCKDNKSRSILMIIFAILVIICIIVLIVICLKRIRNVVEIRNLRGNVNQNKTNEQLEQELLFTKKIYYIFKNEIKPLKYTIEKPVIDEICTVCLEKFEQSKLICIMPCNHSFHYKCINDYILNTKDTLCPLCKFDFLTILKDKNIDFNKIDAKDIKIDSSLNNNDTIENNNNENFNNVLSLRANNINM